MSIIINGDNSPPTAYADTTTIAEDTATVTGNVLANDTDVDTGTNIGLTVMEINGVTNQSTDVSGTYGSLNWNSNGTYSYALNNNLSSVQSLSVGETLNENFTYVIQDPFGATSTSTLTIIITGTNDAPTAVADTATTGENATLTVDVLAYDTDLDTSDSLSITAATLPANSGSVSVVTLAGHDQLQFNPGIYILII